LDGIVNSHYPTVPAGPHQSSKQTVQSNVISMADMGASTEAGVAHMPLDSNNIRNAHHHGGNGNGNDKPSAAESHKSSVQSVGGVRLQPTPPSMPMPKLSIKPPLGFGSGMSGTLPPLKYS
jgi:hypothetical protein